MGAAYKWVADYYSDSSQSVGLAGLPTDAFELHQDGWTHVAVSVNLDSGTLAGCAFFTIRLQLRNDASGTWHNVTDVADDTSLVNQIGVGPFGKTGTAVLFPWLCNFHDIGATGGAGSVVQEPYAVWGASQGRFVIVGDSAGASITPTLTITPILIKQPV